MPGPHGPRSGTGDTPLGAFGLSALIVLAACADAAPPTVPTPPPLAGTVTVDASRPLQLVQDVAGGNFIHTFAGIDAPLDPVARLNIEGLSPRFARVRMALEDWEPLNDDGDPTTFTWSAFQDSGHNRNTFLLMRSLANRGVEITASAWDVPDWMVANPEEGRNRKIPPALVDEAIEAITAWLVHARNVYGVSVAYVSFNEADIGVNVGLTSAEQIALIRGAHERFAAAGLATRWLLGDTAGASGALAYAAPIWDATDIRPWLGPLAFHSWDAGAPDATFAAIADFAEREGLEVRVTEAGWDPFLWQRPAEFPSWNNALQLAAIYGRVLALSRAQALLYWQMLGNDYPLNDGAQGFSAYHVIRALAEHVHAGCRVLPAVPAGAAPAALAVHCNGAYGVQLVSRSPLSTQLTLLGLPDGRYHHRHSSASEADADLGTLDVVAGRATLSVAPQSVDWLLGPGLD